MRNHDRLSNPDFDAGKQAGGKERKDHSKRQLWPLSGRPLDREGRSKDYVQGYVKSYYWGVEDMSESNMVDVVVRMPREEYEAIEWQGLDRSEALLRGVELLTPIINISNRGENYFAVFCDGLEIAEAWKTDKWLFAFDEQEVGTPVPAEIQGQDAIAQFLAQQWQKQQKEKGDGRTGV